MEILNPDITIDMIHQFGSWEYSDMLILRYSNNKQYLVLDFISELKIHALMSCHTFPNYTYTMSIDNGKVNEITLQSTY